MKVGVLAIFAAFLLAAGIPFVAMAGVVVDTDSDTVADSLDNCVLIPNGAAQAPNNQCDTDQDGYGNICDADLDNSGAVGPADFGQFQLGWGLAGKADLNCSGATGPADFGIFQLGWGKAPGPSGLPCAGTIPCP